MIMYKFINCINVMPMPKKQGFQIMHFLNFFKILYVPLWFLIVPNYLFQIMHVHVDV
jgi:hypothetical protein